MFEPSRSEAKIIAKCWIIVKLSDQNNGVASDAEIEMAGRIWEISEYSPDVGFALINEVLHILKTLERDSNFVSNITNISRDFGSGPLEDFIQKYWKSQMNLLIDMRLNDEIFAEMLSAAWRKEIPLKDWNELLGI